MLEMAQEKEQFQSRVRRLEEMLAGVDRFTDPAARACTRQIVQAILELHGTGLNRMLEHLDAAGETGRAVIDQCAADEVVSGLLLLHDLHPLSIEDRVGQALVSIRPYLNSHGGNVELLGITDGVIHLRLQGSCHGCPSSAVTLKQTIESAIWEKAPDAVAIEVKDAEADGIVLNGHGNGHFSLPILAG